MIIYLMYSEIISPGLSLDKRREDQDHDLDDQSISSHHLDQLFKVIILFTFGKFSWRFLPTKSNYI
jgi:hypothetical protein